MTAQAAQYNLQRISRPSLDTYESKYLKYKQKYLKSKLVGGSILRTNNQSQISLIYNDIKSHPFLEDINTSTEYNKYINNLYILLNMYPMPLNDALMTDRVYFISGGIKYGGRYPDIIINKNDIEYGNKFLQLAGVTVADAMSINITKIVNYIHTLYFTNQILQYKADGTVNGDLWKTKVDDTTLCLMKKILDCTDDKSCNKKKIRKLTYTNISMLPYFIGDCREHAFLTAFILNACIQDFKLPNKVGIMYTKAYTIDEQTQTISYLEDHVFCIYVTNDMHNIYIIDPLYSDRIVAATQRTHILYDKNEPNFIEPSSLKNFKFDKTDTDKINDFINAKIYLHCGNVFVNDIVTKKIYNIPLYYNGRPQYITDMQVTDEMYFYGTKFDKPQSLEKWTSFEDWCR